MAEAEGTVISNLHLGSERRRPVVAVLKAAPSSPGVVASLVMDPAGFLDLFRRQTLPDRALVTIVDRSRRVIARSRDHEVHIGASATPAMMAALRAATEGVVPSRSLDGDRTMVAFATSPLSGWTTMVVTPRESFEAPIWTNLAGVVALLGLVTGLSLVMAGRQSKAISAELAALEADARALGEGKDVAPRRGRIVNFDRVQEALSRAAEELGRREERQTLLIHELNHRVKNTLATVQSLAAQTFRGSEFEARGKFEKRLAALGGAHDLLTQTTWTEVDIRDVVARCGEHPDDRIRVSGPSLLLPPEAALAL